jgi:hypothetical protein
MSIEKCNQCQEDFRMDEGGAMIDTGDGAEPCCPDCLEDLCQCSQCELWYEKDEIQTHDLGDGPELFCHGCAADD